MTDDEQGLQRAEQLEAALSRELASRADFDRNWLAAQLSDLTADADKVERELDEVRERREKQHHELKDINPERHRDADGVRQSTSADAWLAVAGFFVVTAFFLYGTAGYFEDRGALAVFADPILLVFGFLAATPLWSPAPKPPARMPWRPKLPRIKTEPVQLPSGTWRDRLELAQSKLAKLTKGAPAPESSEHLQQLLSDARADLQEFIADGRVYLANTDSDHLGWRGVRWPESIRLFRLSGFFAVPAALAPLGFVNGQIGLLHGAIAFAGGLAAGFFRRSNLSFVEPPDSD
jgi:hypothetical protein